MVNILFTHCSSFVQSAIHCEIDAGSLYSAEGPQWFLPPVALRLVSTAKPLQAVGRVAQEKSNVMSSARLAYNALPKGSTVRVMGSGSTGYPRSKELHSLPKTPEIHVMFDHKEAKSRLVWLIPTKIVFALVCKGALISISR